MSYEQNNDGMESIDDPMAEAPVPNDDSAPAAAFEGATIAAAENVDTENHVEGSEIASPVDMEKIWADLDVPNEHVTVDSVPTIRRKTDPNKP